MLYDAATWILVMHFLPDEQSKHSLLQSIAQGLKSSAPFILVDVCGEKTSQEFEQIAAIMQLFWQEMGIESEQINKALETINTSIYPLVEARIIELLQQAGFGSIVKFYTGFWGGGWMAIKN